MQLNPYLRFNGNCEAAFKFYERCLGGKIEMMMKHSEAPTPEPVPANWRDKILHVRLSVGAWVLMGSDAPPEYAENFGSFSLSVGVDKPAEADRVFNALAEKGQVRMPMQQTFWAERFGMLVDRFGVPWMVSCEKA